jgi:hypothetical protein
VVNCLANLSLTYHLWTIQMEYDKRIPFLNLKKNKGGENGQFIKSEIKVFVIRILYLTEKLKMIIRVDSNR